GHRDRAGCQTGSGHGAAQARHGAQDRLRFSDPHSAYRVIRRLWSYRSRWYTVRARDNVSSTARRSSWVFHSLCWRTLSSIRSIQARKYAASAGEWGRSPATVTYTGLVVAYG